MIETTVGHLRSHPFQQAWSKVLNHNFGGRIKYDIVKMEKGLQAELVPAMEALEAVAKTLGEVDALKNYVIKEENRKQWGEEIAKVNEIKLNIDRTKLSMQELDKVNLSALDLLSLEFMLHELESVPGGDNGQDEKSNEEKA